MTPVVWTEPAVEDLEAIREFISRDSAVYAADTIERIVNAVGRLSRFPRSGRNVPEVRSASIREIVVAPSRDLPAAARSGGDSRRH